MALLKCKECGGEVSSQAKSCPKCGAPPPKRTSPVTMVIAGLFAVGFIGALLNLSDQTSTSGTSAPAREKQQIATIDKSEEMQAGRKALIEKLIASGVFQKVEMPGSLPRLWVRPSFYALDFDNKQKVTSVIYAYFFDGTNISDTVRIFDSLSGKEIGSYSPAAGGLELE